MDKKQFTQQGSLKIDSIGHTDLPEGTTVNILISDDSGQVVMNAQLHQRPGMNYATKFENQVKNMITEARATFTPPPFNK